MSHEITIKNAHTLADMVHRANGEGPIEALHLVIDMLTTGLINAALRAGIAERRAQVVADAQATIATHKAADTVRKLMQVAHTWAGPDENDSRDDSLEMAIRAALAQTLKARQS